MDKGALWATVHGVAESDMHELLSTHALQRAPSRGLHQHAFLRGYQLAPARTPDWHNARGRKHVSPEDKGACRWRQSGPRCVSDLRLP